MSLAPMPRDSNGSDVDLSASAEVEDVRASFRETLAKIKARKTSRLNEDSRLFKLQKKLTTVAEAGDVERRRRMLEEHEAEPSTSDSGVNRVAG